VTRLGRLGVGLGFRGPLRGLFADPAVRIDCAEVVAEHFFGPAPTPPARPPELAGRPVLVHCLDSSLGTPGPLDAGYLERVARVVRGLEGAVVSDHLAITRTAEVELGHLNPVPPTPGAVRRVADKIRQIAAATGRPFLLENIATHLAQPGGLSFAELYQRMCEEADCGMLLDVTNLYVNCRNAGRDPERVLDALDLSRVVQLHVVGYGERDGRLFDSHTADIQEPPFALTGAVLARAPAQAVIVERDGCFPAPGVLAGELRRLQALFEAARAPAPAEAP